MYTVNPIKYLTILYRNKFLIKQLVLRDISSRYQGTYFGLLWVVLDPLIMLAVYTFVFRVVFHRHWYTEDESLVEFGLIIFSGLLVFNLFRETITNAPRLIVRNSTYIKKVVFPLEILSCVSILAGCFHLCISILVFFFIYLFVADQLYITIIYIPVILFPLLIILLGASYLLSSLGVYLRDIGQFINMVVMSFLFLSAIFYPIESVPEKYQVIFYLNPIAFTVEQFRRVAIFGIYPDWYWLLFYYAICFAVGWLGFYLFQKTRKGFVDVL